MTVTSVVSVGDGERSTGMGKLNAARRKKLPAKSFAIPGKKAYPIPDRSHAANALARVEQHGSPAEKAQVKRAVAKRYPSMPSVVAAAKREKAKRSKKTDKAYSVDDSERHRDVELGSYGSKWRHGWIPLNAAATSLKLKQLRAGGKSHAAGDHQSHVAPTHRGGHAALIVHPDGSSHYVEHASARGALLTAKRHPSVGAPKARLSIRETSYRGATGHQVVGKNVRGQSVKVFTDRGHADAEQVKANIAAGRDPFAHHSEARTRADQITALGEKSPYGDLSKHSDAELKRRMGSVHAESPAAAIYAKEIDRRKYAELRKAGLDHEQATAGVAKIRAAKPSEAPRPDAAQTFRKAMTPAKTKTTSEGVDKVETKTKAPSAKTSKTTRGHYLIAEHQGSYDYGTKKVGEPHYTLHRVSATTTLGQPAKVEHYDMGRRVTEDYNPTRYKYGGTIPGDSYNAVAFGRGDTRKFASREEAKAHLETMRGETPKRVVRIPSGLKIEQRKPTYGGPMKHYIVHEGSGKTLGGGGMSKSVAENTATHLGRTGIDFRQEADKVVADMKAATPKDRFDQPDHPLSILANASHQGAPNAYPEDLTGNLSPHTPPSIAKMSRTEKQDKALSLIQERLASKDATPAENLDKSNVKIGQKISYTLRKPGSPGESTQRTGRVWHADGNRVFVTSKDPSTGRVEMHSGYLGSEHFDVENTKQQKEAAELEMKTHAARFAASRESASRKVAGYTQTEHSGRMGTYKTSEPIYEPKTAEELRAERAYGTREGKSFDSMAAMFAAADAEFKKRMAERKKVKVPA